MEDDYQREENYGVSATSRSSFWGLQQRLTFLSVCILTIPGIGAIRRTWAGALWGAPGRAVRGTEWSVRQCGSGARGAPIRWRVRRRRPVEAAELLRDDRRSRPAWRQLHHHPQVPDDAQPDVGVRALWTGARAEVLHLRATLLYVHAKPGKNRISHPYQPVSFHSNISKNPSS